MAIKFHWRGTKAIVAAKGKPNKKVKVYRAVPKGGTEINSGDWVTLSKEYAKMHGEKEDQKGASARAKESIVKADCDTRN